MIFSRICDTFARICDTAIFPADFIPLPTSRRTLFCHFCSPGNPVICRRGKVVPFGGFLEQIVVFENACNKRFIAMQSECNRTSIAFATNAAILVENLHDAPVCTDAGESEVH